MQMQGRPGSSMDQGVYNRVEAQKGISFKTDLSNIGTSRSNSRLFGGVGFSGATSIIDEERRLIDKVFSIVDKDNSGAVDMEELKDMFKLFGVDSHYLTSAIQRIMSNVDKDFDGMISPSEFYLLLSQKFEKGDLKADIQSVFNRMDKDKDGKLDVEEMYEVSQLLGESVSKAEIKDMIKAFNKAYQEDHKAWVRGGKKKETEPKEATYLTFQDFYDVMQEEL
mmetsp:Transcript_85601/g.261852  ORF Transcript_85601/g.261852 Transcript_85601/m.261852 type:complete len:223 (-) Transcript_85601:88-756(-)